MLRGVLSALAVSAVVVLGPTGADPATAARAGDQVNALPVHPEWGSILGVDGTLRRGCRVYTFSYSISPPNGIWGLEIFISGPQMESLAGGAFLDGFDPESGAGSFTLCRNTTTYGTFTIKAKLSVDDGRGHITEGQLPPDTFTLGRRTPELWNVVPYRSAARSR